MQSVIKRQVRQGSWSDSEITDKKDDGFGFQDYAEVIARLAAEADTPLMIGIFGRWGSGKTSLMQLIQGELKRKQSNSQRIEPIWINAWRLSNQEEIWNAFLQALLNGVHSRLPFLRRLAFDLYLFSQRLDFRMLLRALLVNSYRILIVIFPVLVTSFWPTQLPEEVSKSLTILLDPYTGGAASLILGLWLLVKPAVEATREKVSLDLGQVLKQAPYEIRISALQQLQEVFSRMVKAWVGEKGRLVVFIDDLDRTPPGKPPEVLEAIKSFATTQRCVYVIGLDHEVLVQGIARKYSLNPEESEEYLEKIIQLPFPLPPLQDIRISSFVQRFYPDVVEECNTSPAVFSHGLEPNPRKVKRALNIFRFLLKLSQARIRAWVMDPLDKELLAKMVVIQSRFPRLHSFLAAQPQFLFLLEEEAIHGTFQRESFGADLQHPLFENSLDNDAPGLLDEQDLPSLQVLLKAGQARYSTLAEPADLLPYILLTSVEKEGAEMLRPSREDRDTLLSNDLEKVRQKVEEIEGRARTPEHKREILNIYNQRLDDILGTRDQDIGDSQLRSANYARTLFEIAQTGDRVTAYLHAIERDPQDPTPHDALADEFQSRNQAVDAERERAIASSLDPGNKEYRAKLLQIRQAREKGTRRSFRPGRQLSPSEIAEARLVYGDRLDYSRIRLVENAGFINWIDGFGRWLKRVPPRGEFEHNAVSIGNTVYFSKTLSTSEAVTRENSWEMEWLIHEMMHTWQYQRFGLQHLFRSLLSLFGAQQPAYDYGGEERLSKGHEKGMSLADFNPEQQANIVQAYYTRLISKKDVSAWMPYIEEIQKPTNS